VAIAKQKRPGTRKIRKAIGQQLRYIRRDIGHIEKQVQAGARLASLKAYDYRCLLVAHEIYRQQEEMWREKKHRIEHRIVSLSQPWVRPIVRGKASAKVEFGAKISVSVSGGYASLHRLSWEAYNEGGDLVGQVESYRERHGHYPESVHADKIYRTRANRQWCQQRGIRLSGPPLGRPPASDGGERGRSGPSEAGRTGSHPCGRQVWQRQAGRHLGASDGQTDADERKRDQHRPDRAEPEHPAEEGIFGTAKEAGASESPASCGRQPSVLAF